MSRNPTQKSLLAGMIAMLVALPGWAATGSASPSSATESPVTENSQQAQQAVNQPAEQQTPRSAVSTPASPETAENQPLPADDAESGIAATDSGNPLYELTPAQLRDMEVRDTAGNKVGEVAAVVRNIQQDTIQLVISSGGILGFGEREVSVPLSELQFNGDHLEIGATQSMLENREEFQPENYVGLQPEDKPISEFSAFEVTPEQPSPDPAQDRVHEQPTDTSPTQSPSPEY